MTQKKFFVRDICNLVNKNKHLEVSLINIKFYGVHQHSDEKMFEVSLEHDGGTITFYVEEGAFSSGKNVPFSGNHNFIPGGFEDGSEDKKLTLAGCGCIYKYCTVSYYKNYQQPAPPILK